MAAAAAAISPVPKDDLERIAKISATIRVIPDFPKPGIMFQDITTLLLDPVAFKDTIDLFVERYKHMNISVVAGVEARGFIFGPPIALAIGAKFVPIRKPKKLPGEVISEEYSLEYGTDKMEMHVGAVQPGDRALVVDDLIATGGTLCAAMKLLERVEAHVVECACVIELAELKGRDRLGEKPLFVLGHSRHIKFIILHSPNSVSDSLHSVRHLTDNPANSNTAALARAQNDVADRIAKISSTIRIIPDFPKPGIMFHDITTLLLDHAAFKDTIDLFVERYKDMNISVVAGVEARGFIFGPPIALAIGAKFVPLRKPNRLPGEVISEEYSLEYGTDIMEMHLGAVQAGDQALVVDDLIATGGTLCAAMKLLERVGAHVVECACVVELVELKGRDRLGEKPLFVLVSST
uniref:adenine phosphoribosyltransferase n=2 Tax=Daucus carota subsp. sativus TaxID=79200 RepID=A0A161ZZ10_DAUCS